MASSDGEEPGRGEDAHEAVHAVQSRPKQRERDHHHPRGASAHQQLSVHHQHDLQPEIPVRYRVRPGAVSLPDPEAAFAAPGGKCHQSCGAAAGTEDIHPGVHPGSRGLSGSVSTGYQPWDGPGYPEAAAGAACG